MTPKQQSDTNHAQTAEQLSALASLSRHVGLIAPSTALAVSEDELRRRLCVYGSETLDACLSVIADLDAHPLRRAACAILLECFTPGWRDAAPCELVGMIVSRDDPEVRRWRDAVLMRNEHRCSDCGEESNLHAHHIVRWADAPALRVVVENGRTLCRKCHEAVHAKA